MVIKMIIHNPQKCNFFWGNDWRARKIKGNKLQNAFLTQYRPRFLSVLFSFFLFSAPYFYCQSVNNCFSVDFRVECRPCGPRMLFLTPPHFVACLLLPLLMATLRWPKVLLGQLSASVFLGFLFYFGSHSWGLSNYDKWSWLSGWKCS